MVHRVIFTLAVVFVSALIVVPGHAIRVERPFLYAIEKNGRSAFLFGTLHILSTADLPPYILKTLDHSGTVAVESNVTAFDFYKIYSLVRPLGPSLQDELSPQAWDKLRSTLSQYDGIFHGLFPFPLKMFSPALACFFHDLILNTEESGGHKISLDEALLVYAREHDKRTDALEDADTLFKGLSMYCTTQELEASLLKELRAEGDKSEPTKNEAWYDSYLKGNERELAEAIKHFRPQWDTPQDWLTASRNQLWMPKIHKLVQSSRQPTFIAVGAAHLFGELGLLSLLKTQGYRITRLDSEEKFNQFVHPYR